MFYNFISRKAVLLKCSLLSLVLLSCKKNNSTNYKDSVIIASSAYYSNGEKVKNAIIFVETWEDTVAVKNSKFYFKRKKKNDIVPITFKIKPDTIRIDQAYKVPSNLDFDDITSDTLQLAPLVLTVKKGNVDISSSKKVKASLKTNDVIKTIESPPSLKERLFNLILRYRVDPKSTENSIYQLINRNASVTLTEGNDVPEKLSISQYLILIKTGFEHSENLTVRSATKDQVVIMYK